MKLNSLYLLVLIGTVSLSRSLTYIPIADLNPTDILYSLSDLPPITVEIVNKFAQTIPKPNNAVLNVPSGFHVNIFAENMNSPRWLALTPTGDVLVTHSSDNYIHILRDTDGNGATDTVTVFAGPENSLNMPFGMDFHGGYFYVANLDAVRRYSYANGQLRITGQGVKILDLPSDGGHTTRTVRVSPDGQNLYVSVGAATNVGEDASPHATVIIANIDGTNAQTFASGLRNAIGLDFHPVSDELYVTVNERDGLGDDWAPDYFTRIQAGDFFGWPYACLSPNYLDPRLLDGDGNSLNPTLATQTKTPDVLFHAHSVAIGLAFYTGSSFPAKYKNGAFVAMKGSSFNSQGTGYKIVFIPFGTDNRPVGPYQDFLTGFLTDSSIPSTWGRPVGVIEMPDGSLLFSDQVNSKLYRVQYGSSYAEYLKVPAILFIIVLSLITV